MRRLILWFMPDDMKRKAEAESRAWIGRCRHCNAETSIWDIGGIRYKAATRATTRVKCPACGRFSFMTFEKRRH